MALGTPTSLASGASGTNGTSFATGSLSPTSGAGLLALIGYVNTDNSEGAAPTITGLSGTWNAIAGTTLTPFNVFGIRGFLCTDWSGTGAVTFNAGAGETFDQYGYAVIEVTGGPELAQAGVAFAKETNAAPNTVSVNYGSATDAGNLAIAWCYCSGGAYNATPQTSWTGLVAVTAGDFSCAFEVHYRFASVTAASVDWNNDTTNVAAGTAGIELQEAAASGTGAGVNRGLVTARHVGINGGLIRRSMTKLGNLWVPKRPRLVPVGIDL